MFKDHIFYFFNIFELIIAKKKTQIYLSCETSQRVSRLMLSSVEIFAVYVVVVLTSVSKS